jgi:conjugal transfer pilus assembly protein TrbC
MPTAAEIERARAANPQRPSESLRRTPTSSPPRIDVTPPNAPIGIEALARRYYQPDAGFHGAGASIDAGPLLAVFVSMSMPRASLSRIVEQASRTRATIVVRGLVENSIRRTTERAREIIGERQVSWQIDPEAFRRFGITRVPTTVLSLAATSAHDPATPCNGSCIADSSYVAVVGDVSLDYALEHIETQRPAFATQARAFLRRLKA